MFSNIPNLLSLSRLPLAAAMFLAIAFDRWSGAAILLAVAVLTDWLDGWWARRFHCGTAVGRALDPLTDKVLVCGAFIFLIPVRGLSVEPWIVTVVIARELIVTAVRGMVEATGQKFGADWFGKLKTVLQFAALFAALIYKKFEIQIESDDRRAWEVAYLTFLGVMLAATVGSAIQYIVKAVRLLR